MENTKKQLLTVCPGLHDAQAQLLENLLSVWKGVRDRLFKHYHFAAKAYFMYLKMGSEVIKGFAKLQIQDWHGLEKYFL